MKTAVVITIASALLAVTSAIPFDKRRFGNDGKPEVRNFEQAVSALDNGTGNTGFFPNLSGLVPNAVLGKAGACAQQDVADTVLGAMALFEVDEATVKSITKMAQTFVKAEKNSQEGKLSADCSRPPKSKALNGLKQAQDPTASGTPPKCNSVYLDMGGGPLAQVLQLQSKIEGALGKKFDDAKADNGKGCNPTNPARAALEGKNGDNGDNGKGKDGDKPKGKDGDKPKGKDGDKPKGKDGDAAKGKDNQNNGCDNTAFTDAVGGVKPPLISTSADGKFQVAGNAAFDSLDNAHQRQCDVQKNQCFNKFNSGDRSFSGQDCENQRATCQAGSAVFAACEK